MEYTGKICQQDLYSWQDDLLTISTELINIIDGERAEEICRHFQCDLSDFREYLHIKYCRIKTNGDKLRSSTDEEIAEMLAKEAAYLPSTILRWLQKEYGA